MTSDLSDELSFTLNGDPMHRGKVRSLIQPIKTYKPKKMELWVFQDYSQIMPHSLGTSLQTDSEEEVMSDHPNFPRASDVDESMDQERRQT